MCVKKFCGRYTGILEEVTNIVSLVLKKKKVNQSSKSLPHFCTVSLATSPSAEDGGWAEETGVLLSELGLGRGEVLVGNRRAEGI